VATLPSVSNFLGQEVVVTDGDGESPPGPAVAVAFSTGWRRISDGFIYT